MSTVHEVRNVNTSVFSTHSCFLKFAHHRTNSCTRSCTQHPSPFSRARGTVYHGPIKTKQAAVSNTMRLILIRHAESVANVFMEEMMDRMQSGKLDAVDFNAVSTRKVGGGGETTNRCKWLRPYLWFTVSLSPPNNIACAHLCRLCVQVVALVQLPAMMRPSRQPAPGKQKRWAMCTAKPSPPLHGENSCVSTSLLSHGRCRQLTRCCPSWELRPR